MDTLAKESKELVIDTLAKDLSNITFFSTDIVSYGYVYFNLDNYIDYRCSNDTWYRVYFYLLSDNHTVMCKFTDIANHKSYTLNWKMQTSIDDWNTAWFFDEATEGNTYEQTAEIFRDEIKGSGFTELLMTKVCEIQADEDSTKHEPKLPETFWNIPEVKQILEQHEYNPIPTEKSKRTISSDDISDIIRDSHLSYGEFLQLMDPKENDYISCIKDLVWAKYLYNYKDLFNENVESEIKKLSDTMRAKIIE